MTDERSTRVSSADSPPDATESSQTRPRKRRRWDEPAESLVSYRTAVPGVIPIYSVGSVAAPCASVSGALYTNLQVGCYATSPPMLQVLAGPQRTPMAPTKLNQHKIQDELLIAREIVINDAEASARYKLTKRQTQEEIEKCTGAVVITRGKYRSPNAPADGEKPLYLHISAGAQLKETAERILAVDRAAAMVDKMLKQGPSLQSSFPGFPAAVSNGVTALSTCVYLGFEADPSKNIAARIRGPNDQYINHIMNETGATVVLRGSGSRHPGLPDETEAQQPLHLFLLSTNSRSLENARSLAENLLQTISLECGASRVASGKVYNAVPPPQQLLGGTQTSSPVTSVLSTTAVPSMTAVGAQGVISSAEATNGPGLNQLNSAAYPRHLSNGGTCYHGYAGIYPQATPLQQVALVLRQSPSSITSTVAPAISVGSKAPLTRTFVDTATTFNSEKEKRPSQRRKFQELAVDSPGRQLQGSELSKPGELLSTHSRAMPPPKAAFSTSLNGTPISQPLRAMPPTSMPPPALQSITPSSGGQAMPPPPSSEFFSRGVLKKDTKKNVQDKTQLDTVPDTLIKLMEYGDEDDEDEEEDSSQLVGNENSSATAARKPFWAA
ncbi:Protein RIK [Linum grandiflorum]